ncbi:MAG: hypothetical protein OXN23_03315 [Gammaproteobacteria bacterium]|nr:hypothetical protein [Gammaproteobacteria bacterium]MDE0612585.1 hypothetical protein [Gammaproteobacteria bacterium]
MSEIALYKALISAGAPEAEAQAAVQDLARANEVATKADLETGLATLEARLIRWYIGGLVGAVLLNLAILKLIL